MTRFRTLLSATVASLGLTLGVTSAQAGSFEHIDDLAAELQGLSNKLSREFRDHYRHTPAYRHLASDARDMRKLAGHIHEIAHFQGDLDHIHDDLHDLDELFHHVDELVDEIEHDAEHHGEGHVHGDTHHVRHILGAMEDTLHHLLEDVEEMTGGYHHDDFGDEGEGHEDHDHDDRGGIGVRFGGGSSRTVIRFGFGN